MSDPGPTDALAAEYVLGTLDSDERTQAQALLVIDQEFVAKVRVWERRLGELHLMVEPVEPEGKLWERIKAKMPEAQPKPEIKLPEPTVAEPAPVAAAAESAPASTDAAPAAKLPPATTLPSATTLHLTQASDMAQALEVARSAPSEQTSILVAPAPKPSVVPPPAPAAAPVLTPGVTRAPPVESKDDHTVRIRRRLTRWRAFATLMMLVVVVAAALLAAWRFAPDRVPPMLQPVELMRFVGVTISALPPRKPAPPESQFDE
jgi:hypothetical protein